MYLLIRISVSEEMFFSAGSEGANVTPMLTAALDSIKAGPDRHFIIQSVLRQKKYHLDHPLFIYTTFIIFKIHASDSFPLRVIKSYLLWHLLSFYSYLCA